MEILMKFVRTNGGRSKSKTFSRQGRAVSSVIEALEGRRLMAGDPGATLGIAALSRNCQLVPCGS
jgi:hypothetical protein